MNRENAVEKVLDTCKKLGIPTIEEKMEQDEEYKKKVLENINKVLNKFITDNYDKYDNKRTV